MSANDPDNRPSPPDPGTRIRVGTIHSGGGGVSVGGDVHDHRQYGTGPGQLDTQTLDQIKVLLTQLADAADKSTLDRKARGAIMTQADDAATAIEEQVPTPSLLERITTVTKTVKAMSEGVAAAAPLYALARQIAQLAGIPLP